MTILCRILLNNFLIVNLSQLSNNFNNNNQNFLTALNALNQIQVALYTPP